MSYVGFLASEVPDILVVCGPTAVGKSDWTIQQALCMGGEIISADAYQVYRGMSIGTAAVSSVDQARVPHHLIGILDPVEGYSVVEFLNRVGPLICDIRARGNRPIICGGTAFYLQAFLYGYSLDDTAVDVSFQSALLARVDRGELPALVDELLSQEPACLDWLDLSNPRRVVRALVQLSKGISPTQASQSRLPCRGDVSLVGLRMDRELLVARIHERVDRMMAMGWVDEVRDLLARGISIRCPAFQAIGYLDVVDYLEGRLGYVDMVDCIKVKTRQFAKRQMTWFRRFEQVVWHDVA